MTQKKPNLLATIAGGLLSLLVLLFPSLVGGVLAWVRAYIFFDIAKMYGVEFITQMGFVSVLGLGFLFTMLTFRVSKNGEQDGQRMMVAFVMNFVIWGAAFITKLLMGAAGWL